VERLWYISLWMGREGYTVSDLYYEVAGLLITFILLGKWMELGPQGKTGEQSGPSWALRPKTATS